MRMLRMTNRLTSRDTNSFKKYLVEITDLDLFTPEEEEACCLRAAEGDAAARHELITRNLRFVISIAKQYEHHNLAIEDLVNEGNIGLMIAAEKYDVTSGFKFISYAVFWIRKLILEYLAKHSRIVRLPANKVNNLAKFNQKIMDLEQTLGRTVDICEVMEALGETLSNDEVAAIETVSTMRFDSFDSSSGEGEMDSNLYDVIPDENIKGADHLVIEADVKLQINRALTILKPRDRAIMIDLYGLNGTTPLSLIEVSEKVNLSREMIRQLNIRCLKALREVIEV